MGYTLLEAAEALDLSSGAVQSYEAGARPEGRRVMIPRTVELACAALAVGIMRYWGPEARVVPRSAPPMPAASVGDNGLRIAAGERTRVAAESA
jgi:hypothetical protein